VWYTISYMFDFIILVLGILGYFSFKSKLNNLINSNERIANRLQAIEHKLNQQSVPLSKESHTSDTSQYSQTVLKTETDLLEKESYEKSSAYHVREHARVSPQITKTEPTNPAPKPHAVINQNLLPTTQEDDWFTKAFKWLFKDFILKIGGLMVISGLVFLLNVGISNGLITPTLQVLLAVVISSIFVVLGAWQIPKNPLPGQVLSLIGSFGLTLSVLGARHLYELIPDSTTTLVLILVVQILSLGIAYLYKKQTLAIIGSLTAGIAPFIIGSTSESVSGLLIYGLVLYIAMLPYVFKTGWKGLSTVSMVIGLLYSGALVLVKNDTQLIYWILTYLGVYNFSNLASVYRATKLKFIDICNSVLINLISIVWIVSLIESELKALILVGVTVFYIFTSIVLKHKALLQKYIQLQFMSGLIAFGFALITQYSNFPALLALLLFAEIFVALYITLKVLEKPNFAIVISSFNLVPLLVTISQYPALISSIYTQNYSLTNSGLQTLLYAMCSVFLFLNYLVLKSNSNNNTLKESSFYFKIATVVWAISIIFISTGLLLPPISGGLGFLLSLLLIFWTFSDRQYSTEKVFNNILLFTSVLAGFRTIWSGLYTLVGESYFVGASFVVYSIIALLLTRYAHKLGKFWKYTNIMIFAFIVGRLFLVEFWQMDMIVRFITFIVIGIMFISTPYIAKKK
jgi:uncharacterized membrane protein